MALKRIYYKRLSEKLTQVQLLKIFAAPASAPSRQNGNASGGNRGGGFPRGGGGFPGGGFQGGDF